jgi:hypothetical protein
MGNFFDSSGNEKIRAGTLHILKILPLANILPDRGPPNTKEKNCQFFMCVPLSRPFYLQVEMG